MKLNNVAIGDTETVRVGTLNFLADGGDLFTAFKRARTSSEVSVTWRAWWPTSRPIRT
jgi:hypothetical protein